MKIFPKSEYQILKVIYENPGIKISELLDRAKVSVGTGQKRLDHLLGLDIIREEKITGGSKTLIRRFYPNFKSEEGKSAYILIESEKREKFMNKNKDLVGPFNQLLRNLDENVKILMIFGSFANYSQTEDSDLDILFLTNGEIDTENLKKEIERSFVTFDHEISPRIDTVGNFRKNFDKEIYQTIVRNHIILGGTSEFIEILANENY